MKPVGITRIEIDDTAKLRVYPEVRDPGYQYVYRAAGEVYWNDGGYFYSPVPREWSYTRWLEQIIAMVQWELGVVLEGTAHTTFQAVPEADEGAMRLALKLPKDT